MIGNEGQVADFDHKIGCHGNVPSAIEIKIIGFKEIIKKKESNVSRSCRTYSMHGARARK